MSLVRPSDSSRRVSRFPHALISAVPASRGKMLVADRRVDFPLELWCRVVAQPSFLIDFFCQEFIRNCLDVERTFFQNLVFLTWIKLIKTTKFTLFYQRNNVAVATKNPISKYTYIQETTQHTTVWCFQSRSLQEIPHQWSLSNHLRSHTSSNQHSIWKDGSCELLPE